MPWSGLGSGAPFQSVRTYTQNAVVLVDGHGEFPNGIHTDINPPSTSDPAPALFLACVTAAF